MRILLPTLLTLAAFAAIAPPTSAVAICSTQADATDLVVGDDPIARESCTTENLISYDCDLVVAVNQDGSLTRTLRCDPLIYCVTEPCPGPVAASASAAPAPCGTVGSPVLDAGFGVQCTAAGTQCHAFTATFGTIEDFLSPDAGCTTSLWPPYDCVQDCDGPAERSAAQGPCTVQADATDLTLLDDPLASVTCSTSPTVGYDCDGRAWVDAYGVHRTPVECDPLIVCVTEPCPGGGPIRI